MSSTTLSKRINSNNMLKTAVFFFPWDQKKISPKSVVFETYLPNKTSRLHDFTLSTKQDKKNICSNYRELLSLGIDLQYVFLGWWWFRSRKTSCFSFHVFLVPGLKHGMICLFVRSWIQLKRPINRYHSTACSVKLPVK